MKRRAASTVESLKSDSSRPSTSRSASSNNIEVSQRAKRKRSGFLGDDSCIENAGTKRRKLRAGVRKRVTRDKEVDNEEAENLEHKEMFEDMGLNILSDNSNSCDTLQQPHNSRSQVLQAQNPNIITIDSPSLSPLKRPAPPANAPTVTNIDIDAGSSSFIETDGNRNSKQLSIEEEFFQYTNTMKGPSRQIMPVIDFFNRLPEELVLSVFKWLPKCTLAKCARVCKRWLKVTQDESLWRRLDLGLVTVPAGVVGQVLSRGCAVLRLARATVLQPVFVSAVSGLPTFPEPSSQLESARLQYLDLSMTSISGPCLELLLSHCAMIRNLSLENAEINDVICSAISANANLSVLHLGGVKGLTEKGIRRILQKCKKLIELNVGWTQLTASALESVSRLLSPSLRRLCLSGHRDTLSDSHIKDLVKSCPNLRDLDVSDSSLLTPASLNTMVESLTYLESVSTSRCYNITPSTYLMLTACPTLLYLNVFGLLREPALEELKERLQGIEINKFMFTSVARPTVGIKRTSIWNLRVRD